MVQVQSSTVVMVESSERLAKSNFMALMNNGKCYFRDLKRLK